MSTENPYRLNIDQVQKYLPHRSPFLLIDRVLEIHPLGDLKDMSPKDKLGVKVVALKNVTYNEPCFQGHFPGFSIMPGVLLIEIMAQAASFSMYPYFLNRANGDVADMARSFQCILVGVDSARFRRPVIPGDTLKIETTVTRCRGTLWGFNCVITVDGQRVADADILANLAAQSEGNPNS